MQKIVCWFPNTWQQLPENFALQKNTVCWLLDCEILFRRERQERTLKSRLQFKKSSLLFRKLESFIPSNRDHLKACLHYFGLFLKEQCVSWLFRTKYFEKKFNLQLLIFPLFHKHLFSPELSRAAHLVSKLLVLKK